MKTTSSTQQGRVKSQCAPGERPGPACTMVIFGAGGDLTKRLLVPALYNLAEAGLLPDDFGIIGLDLSFDDEASWKLLLDATMQSFVEAPGGEFHPDSIDAEAWDWLKARMHYRKGDFTDAAIHEALAAELGSASAFFYLAVAARFFAPIATGLGEAGLLQEPSKGFRRLVVEKPFGSDLASARQLNATLLAHAREDQIFRTDHFMGKETVQSILAMRFGNALFEPLWNRDHIACVEISAAETLGVEGRGKFYEPTGALRDMVPNHLFQLLCMVAMDAPSSLAPEAVRSEKTRLLQAVRTLKATDVIYGQYTVGKLGKKSLPAYRNEPDVSAESNTETYVAARVEINNWRWAGVPFVLRTGKRLSETRTEIVLHLHDAPFPLFADVPQGGGSSDMIVLAIGPDQAIEIAFDVKQPGPQMKLAKAVTRFDFDTFDEAPNVGYEALLFDIMQGDATLFQRADTIEESWRIVDEVQLHPPKTLPYATGSQGPAEADGLIQGGWRVLG